MDQVRFILPDDAAFPHGCYVKIAVAVGDNISNAATVPTSDISRHVLTPSA